MDAAPTPGAGDPEWAGDAVRPTHRDPEPATHPADARPALPVLDDAARSPDPSVCPFLRRQVDGVLSVPLGDPDLDHSCVAIGAPRPQSLRQQELVCMRVAHSDCPRYLRGALVAAPRPAARSMPTVPRATLAALLILVLSAGISFGFVVQRGGIAMPVVGAGSTPLAVVATPTTAPTDVATEAPPPTAAPASVAVVASPSAAATIAPTPSPTPIPTASPSPAPPPTVEPTAKPTPKPTAKQTAKPTSDRYRLLDPCPDRAGCWIYKVRSGDNLYSIAKYFGHPLSTIYQWNPQYPAKRLNIGDPIRMPPPTR